MKKTLLMVLILSSCSGDRTPSEKTESYSIICLDGVQYWEKKAYAYKGFLAPKFNIDGTLNEC